MFLFQLSTIILLTAVITAQSDSDEPGEELELSLRSATRCTAKDDGPGFCLPIRRCRRIMDKIRKFQNPNICFFRGSVPNICCPVTLRGSDNSRPNQGTTRRQPITPVTRTPSTPRYAQGTTSRRPSQNVRPVRPQQISATQTASTLNPTGCGRNALPAEGTGLIVGGKEARQHAWPWMAGIRQRTFGQNTRFMCGGSLITRRHILTAAHCFGEGGGNRQPSDFRVVLGSHFRDSGRTGFPSEDGVVIATPIAIRVHEEYRDNAQDNDVAIMLLDTDVPITDYIKPVCLPSRANYIQEAGYVTVIGWGDTNYGGENSKTLQQASFEIVPAGRCRYMFRRVQLANGITDGMLCAGNVTGGVDSCQNDSGGPLLEADTEENIWTQVGIVSFGYKCAERGFPGVYTRVANYLPWIQRTVRRMTP